MFTFINRTPKNKVEAFLQNALVAFLVIAPIVLVSLVDYAPKGQKMEKNPKIISLALGVITSIMLIISLQNQITDLKEEVRIMKIECTK